MKYWTSHSYFSFDPYLQLFLSASNQLNIILYSIFFFATIMILGIVVEAKSVFSSF